MKALIKIIFLLILGSSMTGCALAHYGPSYSEFAPSINELPQNTGRIFFYGGSSTTFFMMSYMPKVTMNYQVIGKAIDNGFFYADKKPGNYEIMVMASTGFDRKVSFMLKDGQTRYVRFVEISGTPYPEEVAPEVGIEEIQQCYYTGDLKTSN
jgi:hypothetical protein